MATRQSKVEVGLERLLGPLQEMANIVKGQIAADSSKAKVKKIPAAKIRAQKQKTCAALPGMGNHYAQPIAKHVQAFIEFVLFFQKQDYIRTCEEVLFVINGENGPQGWVARIMSRRRDPYDKNSFTALVKGQWSMISDPWVGCLYEMVHYRPEEWWRDQIMRMQAMRNNVFKEQKKLKPGKAGSFHRSLMKIKRQLLETVPAECAKLGLTR